MTDALKPGDWVDIEGMAAPGELQSVDARRKSASVLVRGQAWTLPLAKLKPGEAPRVTDSHERDAVRLQPVSGPAPAEVDLHGMRVEDALLAADHALDRAAAGGALSLRIVHGHGTGRVRTAVREMLGNHPHVANFRFGVPAEGGTGATVVEIRHGAVEPKRLRGTPKK